MRKLISLTLILLLSQSVFAYDGEDYEEPAQDYVESDAVPTQLPTIPLDEQSFDEASVPEVVPTPIPMDDAPTYEPTENDDEY